MNEQLTQFIELCLADGVISEKEREVIFRKSKELGVPDDECEILIDSLVSKYSKKTSQPEPTKKKGGFFSSMFNEIKKNIDTDSIKSSFNQVKEDIKKGYNIEKEKVEQGLQKIREEQIESQTTSTSKASKPKSNTSKKASKPKSITSSFYSVDEVGIIVKHPESMKDGIVFDLTGNRVYKISKTMRQKSFNNKTYLGQKKFKSGTMRWVEVDPNDVESRLSDNEFIKLHSLEKSLNKLKSKNTNQVAENNSLESIKEKGVLFSIDFSHNFMLKGKLSKIVFETWKIKKDCIEIYNLDNKSQKDCEYFLNPFRGFKEFWTDYDSNGERVSRSFLSEEPNGVQAYGEDDIIFSMYWKSSINYPNYLKLATKVSKKFKESKFKFKKDRIVYFKDLEEFSFSVDGQIKLFDLMDSEYYLELHDNQLIKAKFDDFDDKPNVLFDRYHDSWPYLNYCFLKHGHNRYDGIAPSETNSKNLFPPLYKYNINNILKDIDCLTSEEKNDKDISVLKENFTKLKVLIEKGYEEYLLFNKGGVKIAQKNTLALYQVGEDSLIIDNDVYYQILKKNQKLIIDKDDKYVQRFIKLNNYQKEKFHNLSNILKKLKLNVAKRDETKLFENEEEINFFKGIVYSYNMLIHHSVVMITALLDNDMITFYEIYEVLDKMNVFNTNWENEVNDKLSEINESLVDLNFSIRGLMTQMRGMERNIVKGLASVNTSIGSLETSINKQLSETNSRLKYENLTNYYKKSTLPGVMDWFDGPN